MKLLDYIRGLRKGKEAHQLEKESMKDPFLADAMDGYHQVKGNHEQQIKKLQTQVSAYSTKKKNSYAIIWSVAACLIMGIGISSYFLFLKENRVDDTFIANEITSLTTQKSDSDSVHTITKSQTNHKDKIAKSGQVSKPNHSPQAIIPVRKEDSLPKELTEETIAITLADTSISKYNLQEKIRAKLIAQTHPMIKGKITDMQGEPLIGANITYRAHDSKEIYTGTITDPKGEFSLFKEKGDGKLTVNYIGFDPVTIPVDTNQTMLIAMNESKSQMDEVVVVGYGTQKKQTVTGAVTSVNIDSSKVPSSALVGSISKVDLENLIKASKQIIPEPVIGMKKYQKYLKKKLIRPTDETCNRMKGKVVLVFFVDRKGRPFHFIVEKGLCESTDKEAIRLIREGPDWTLGNKSVKITVEF